MLMLETEAPVTTVQVMVQEAMDELAAHTADCAQCWAGVCDEGNMLVRRAIRVRAERDRLAARPRLV